MKRVLEGTYGQDENEIERKSDISGIRTPDPCGTKFKDDLPVPDGGSTTIRITVDR